MCFTCVTVLYVKQLFAKQHKINQHQILDHKLSARPTKHIYLEQAMEQGIIK